MKIRSLRARLLLGTTVTMIVVLGLLGVAVDAFVHRTLVKEFDNALLSKAQAIASFVEQHDNEIRFEFDPQRMPEFVPGEHPAYFEVWVEGQQKETSPSLAKGESLSHGELTGTRTEFASVVLPDHRHGRVVAFPFAAYVDEEDNDAPSRRVYGVLFVAIETRDLDRTLATIRWMIAGLCLGAIGVCAAALLAVVNRAVHPVMAVASKIGSMRETDLSSRIEAAGLPSELCPMIDRLNGLLERLEAAFDRERSFTADVAHELRTPIAGLRTTLEVCRSRPRDPTVYATAIDRSLKVIHSMQTVIENLLLLARAESGQLAPVVAEVDLSDLVRDAWTAFAGRALESHLAVRMTLPEACIVPADTAKLRIVLTNLFDNAVSYTNPGGTIDIELSSVGAHTQFRISNSGNQITPEELPRLFERFWRKDEARSQTGLHAGLGLSLCQRLLSLSNATISAGVESDRFIIAFTLPQQPKSCVPAR
ncbi:MAG TPA: ATP-binding protein [Phycisphaerae bacterium]|nr:ATP-binding protein [Phycisphaerae bacterium]